MAVRGTFATCRWTPTMSVDGGRPEVNGGRSKAAFLTQHGLDRLPYASTRAISEICIRRCEPVHIDPARLVPPSSGALQRGREKRVPSFLPSRRLRPSSQLAQPRSQLASIGIACKATTMLARAIVGSPATSNVRLPHRAARPTAWPILISRTPPS